MTYTCCLIADGTLTVVHVLVSTALSGLLQSILGGQPLLIIGVAEPIVIMYGFLYSIAEGQQGLGKALFLPWAAWVCVWTSLMVLILAVAGSCRLIDKFTRFSGELFGMLIAILFLEVAIKVSGSGPKIDEAEGSGFKLPSLHPTVDNVMSLLIVQSYPIAHTA